MATDYRNDANIISYWMLEESASPSVDGKTTNNNDLTWTGAAAAQNTTQFVQGSSSIKCTAESLNLPTATLASLSSNFPFLSTTTTYTIGGWIYLHVLAASGSIQVFTNTAQGYAFGTTGTSNILEFSLPGVNNITANTTISAGVWISIIARWNGDNVAGAGANDEVSFWINGTKQTATLTAATMNVVTGGNGFILYGYDVGVMNISHDEWFVFNRALLDTEIAEIYAHGLAGDRNNVSDNLMGAICM